MKSTEAAHSGTYRSLDEYVDGGPPITADTLVKGFYSAMLRLGRQGRHRQEASEHPVWVGSVERSEPSALYVVKLDFVDLEGQTLFQSEALFANGLLVPVPDYAMRIGKQPVTGGYLREGETYSIPRLEEPASAVVNSPLVPAFA